jgi:hypothetical protein
VLFRCWKRSSGRWLSHIGHSEPRGTRRVVAAEEVMSRIIRSTVAVVIGLSLRLALLIAVVVIARGERQRI